jgi:transcription antitermination factor NusG
MPSDVDRWYVVRAAFGREKEADIEVRLDGFTVFNPSIFRKAALARRDTSGVMRPGKPARAVPLLGRYFFVQLNLADPYWYQIKRLPGVDCIMSGADLESGASASPIAVQDSALVYIRGLLEPNECHYPDGMPHERQAGIEAGTPLRVLEGPLADRTGVCDESDGLEVKLTLFLMGHLVPVTLPQSAVQVIKPT